MFILIIVFVSMGLMISAFAFKRPELHAAALLGWLISTWLLVTDALGSYSGTYIPTAVALFGMSMVILETVFILLPYLHTQRSQTQRYNERQATFRGKIAGMSRRTSRNWWAT